MSELTRGLWLQRLWGTTVVAGAGLLLAALAPWPLGLAAAAPAFLVALLGVLATQRLTAGLRQGDRGELLLASGARVSVHDMRYSWLADRAELAVLVLLGIEALLLAIQSIDDAVPALLMIVEVAAAVGLFLPIHLQRGTVRALFSAQLALQAGDLPELRRWLGRLRRRRVQGDTLAAVERMEAMARIREGDVEGGSAALDRTWSGALDASAVPALIRRIGRGELDGARRWLDGWTGEDRYRRYLHDLLAAHLALAEGHHDEAARTALAHADELPAWYRRELQLVAGAARRAAGDEAGAEALLGPLDPPLSSEPWRARLQPHLWSAAGEAPVAGPTARLPEPGPVEDASSTPFAAPQSAPRAVEGRRRFVGMIPVDWIPLLPGRRRSAVAAMIGLVLVVGVLVVLGPIVGLLYLGGDDDELLLPMVVVGLCTLLLVTLLPRVTLELLGSRGPAAVRTDGERIDLSRFTLWRAARTAPQLVAIVLILALPPLIEWTLAGSAFTLLATAPVCLVLLWAQHTRSRRLRLLEALHTWRPARARALCETLLERGSPGGGVAFAGTGLGLMRLWEGDTDGALEAFERVGALYPSAGTYAAWIGAARGDVDVAQVLAHPAPAELGDAWRHAVLVGIAALAAGRAPAVVDRLDHWDELASSLPNRFGALLHQICAAVRARADLDPQDVRTLLPEHREAMSGLLEAWPFLQGTQPSSSSGSAGSSR